MGTRPQPRLLGVRAMEGGIAAQASADLGRSVRSVTVNVAESPLGWLYSRGLVTPRQFEAGERLRDDWERAQLAPRVTMSWDAAPVARGRGGSANAPDLSGAQIDAKRRFDAALENGEWRYQGDFPVTDKQLEVFSTTGRIQATVPGGGMLMMS